MVNQWGLKPYQLPQAASCLSRATVLYKTEAQHYNPFKNGQHHGSDVCKQNGGHSIPGTLPPSPDYMELVPATEYISDCRTPPWEGEHYRRRRVQEYEGPMRLDVESSQIQALKGPLEIDLFASRLAKQLPRFYSWRLDLEAENTDAFSQDWSKVRSFANPPWCLIAHSLSQTKQQRARSHYSGSHNQGIQ